MDAVKMAASERSPEVDFDFDANSYALRGESYPEDVNEFYGPLIEKLEAHLRAQSGTEIGFTFEFIYFNSSTAKIVMGLFERLEEVAEAGNTVSVTWIFEEDDDTMEELGEEFGEDLEAAKFELKEVPAD